MEDVNEIKRVLIANRGEIARRIIKTCRQMDIVTIAVYADSDEESPFVNEADIAVKLGGKTPLETYLNQRKILEACEKAEADSVHPGYGFLSENHEFAELIVANGLNWIGPSPKIIQAMGDKLSAKDMLDKAGVPMLPSIEISPETDISNAAKTIGYPVLVKASAGGGGKGMRVVESPETLVAAVESAQREAKNAFGDDKVFLEKWLESVKHVEVQIVGDKHGNILHCFERECSIQRRHQKIIEEAPSPAVDEKLREALGKSAIEAAKTLNYFSTGTVEFLLSEQDFYFLEVNTRLQVEHPVTEEILGIDLVREQIRIAENKKLSFSQDDLQICGHAIEARVYAEDPQKNFLPSPGKIQTWAPSFSDNVRFDSGVEEGSFVSPEFDPMIAKVICHAPTRTEAAKSLAKSLRNTKLYGIKNNKEFLELTLLSKSFLDGDTTTDFIERVNPNRIRELSSKNLEEAAIAIAMESQAINRNSARVLRGIRSGWRNSVMPPQTLRLESKKTEMELNYQSQRDGSFSVSLNAGEPKRVKVFSAGYGEIDIEIDGFRSKYEALKIDRTWYLQNYRGQTEFKEAPKVSSERDEDFSSEIKAPMPGSVIKTFFGEQDKVSKGDTILILEAMKMEHQILAPRNGTISRLHARTGDQVSNNQTLVSFDDEGEKSR